MATGLGAKTERKTSWFTTKYFVVSLLFEMANRVDIIELLCAYICSRRKERRIGTHRKVWRKPEATVNTRRHRDTLLPCGHTVYSVILQVTRT
uniref:Uncharacterized protein n=1 Tax=Echeneis naucrates TaxID=173247 RepID=A0A665WFL5_ECHNA